MKVSFFKSGAVISSAVAFFAWQLPLILASLGLGSLTLGVWMVSYRWVFMIVTLVFLGIAYYRTFFQKKRSADPWGKRMLYVTTALSLGLVGYTFLFR